MLRVLDSSLRDGSCYINKACTVLKLALIQDLGFAVISPDCKRKAEPDQRASSSFKDKTCRPGQGTISFLRGVQELLPSTPKQPSATDLKQCLKQTHLSHWSRKWSISREIRKTKVQFVGSVGLCSSVSPITSSL